MEARISDINRNEILMYLGYRGQEIDQALSGQLERCLELVLSRSTPRLVYRRVKLAGGSSAEFPAEGNDIRELLAECREAVYCAVTLGAGVEQLLIRSEVTNMSDALIMDACASTVIENVIGNFEADCRAEAEKDGLYLTSRFSPGYGDMPLALQRNWCRSLDTERRIGLHVTEDSIMIPRKSVTAVMGISTKPQKLRAGGCEICSMFSTCIYRKEGRSCHE